MKNDLCRVYVLKFTPKISEWHIISKPIWLSNINKYTWNAHANYHPCCLKTCICVFVYRSVVRYVARKVGKYVGR